MNGVGILTCASLEIDIVAVQLIQEPQEDKCYSHFKVENGKSELWNWKKRENI